MEYTILILLLPLLSFLLLGIGGKWITHRTAGFIGTAVLGVVAVLSYVTAVQYFSAPRLEDGTFATWIPYNFEWLPFTETLTFNIGILLDPISVMMLIVISTVSLMVHIYSFGYMKGEKGFQRYYAFLSLFTMSMLGLVVATNIFQMYLFWELVGVSSYLLIGFYYTKPAAIAASKKAFIVTRFADLGFLIGILIYGYYGGTFGFTPDTVSLISGGASMLPLALGLMFVGGAGKSAMFPLHIWLPDAMEGPTPVSALIHAATMVVAGVYLVARMFPLFIAYAPDVLHWIAYVGAFTAFYAASVACVQSDIKRVLAFSTISQIGFMIVALGVCTSADPHHGGLGYMASMFHLFTHAMFKALLFLGAGSIIHAVHSNEMSAMGGLRKYMPITHITFLIACLAIAGIPPFSGFFSKDEILAACFQFSPVMGWIMTVIAAMTAFYMFRLYYGIFWGKDNSKQSSHTPHESPTAMTIPLIFLALVTCGAGFIPFGHFISSNGESYTIHLDWTVAGTSIVIALLSIALATYMYKGSKQPVADSLQRRFSGLWTAAYHRFYIDEVYQFITHKIIFRCISKPIAWFDRHVIDGTFDFIAWAANAASDSIRGFQSGQIQQYTYVFLCGALALILLLIL
ncbi:NADH-quinone oxidoreductase subunit L [Bacteroides salyersiae]|jgi:proton-translocating NADH-quinone oxidoreductase, chain L|uniref:NADH-quinone oxidoreductase subunit L n=1 Tax=Bacteroides salyersiae TaxID=291644 RepID=UPI00125D1094|nr:NADH-quinone oxidoreductase subunit L [Bacteroides salyersiae]KAB5348566.1 NADH-quinone oxidoreductase subunit L [Bacteroides salyersiae]KAB5355008.1 NADH-quinone oxidoreductase subunit L [Bacteroides salyersiae]KAB5368738.1 NADH-quinone oxidoreductase subunit L [Bacteroides salyersiae]KAB5378915.1 NADH-quinone oxidoreductase subunit L [Bacteroides salyersiae]KAB5382284.1 NADH-quinone oxidoreductase subunit L [Bacteroides salyersiae]